MADTHPIVVVYQEIVNGTLSQFLKLSQEIGGEVKTQADMIADAFKIQLEFLRLVPRCKAPAQNELADLLKPFSEKIAEIQAFREKNRPSKFINHLSAVSESCLALFWVEVTPTPGPYVKDLIDAGQFYSNRVLIEYKDKDKCHVEWVKTWTKTLTEVQQYVKQHHTTGLSWNPRGETFSGVNLSKLASGGGRAPPPPPGPPPPPPPSFEELSALSQPAVGEDRAALFQQLNRGEDITKTLRKVTSDQQTHKNPALRLQPTATGKPATSPRPYPANGVAGVQAAPPVKPPKFELQGKKWVIEYHTGNKNLVVGDTAMNQAIYIFSCNDCVVQVKGKVNSITMDACKKSSLVFHDIVSSVEFVNCQRIQTQAMGKVPLVSIDKTDGIQVYLNKDSLDTELITSKSSEMNLLIPKADGDFVEYPVPEQFKTKWTGKNISTVALEQA